VLEIWGRKNSVNVQKVLWCCGELGLPFRRHDAGGLFGGTREPDYLARNPMGLVPTISDGGFELWESNAIVRYLSAEYGSGTLWPQGTGNRALADKWMDYGLGTLFPAFRDALLGLVRTPAEERDEARIAASAQNTANVLSVLEAHLEGQEYVAGPSLTMGDVAVGPIAYRWLNLPIDRPTMPNLEAWHERLAERQAYREHVMVSFVMEDPA
jgi:glutathione S-transferase